MLSQPDQGTPLRVERQGHVTQLGAFDPTNIGCTGWQRKDDRDLCHDELSPCGRAVESHRSFRAGVADVSAALDPVLERNAVCDEPPAPDGPRRAREHIVIWTRQPREAEAHPEASRAGALARLSNGPLPLLLQLTLRCALQRLGRDNRGQQERKSCED